MPSRHVLSLVVVTLLPLPASAAETLWTEIIVRVYDTTGVPPDARRAALKIAASTVSSASIDVVMRTCPGSSKRQPSPASRRPDPCNSPLIPGELALRIVVSGDAVDDDRSTRPLGEALIDTKARTGVLATVYADRVNWMAARTGVDPDELLGRAIAHELGHLLMGTSTHGATGLMRAVWSQSEMRRGETRDWAFEPREIAAIRARTGGGQETARTNVAALTLSGD
jgi:hypothetical protein